MTGARAWFADRSLRERRMIVVMVALLALTILWGGIVLPVRDGLADAREKYADAATRLGDTQNAVDALNASRRIRPLTGSLADGLRADANAAGFTLGTLDEQGAGRVHLTIQSARAPALNAWLARLERLGMLIEAATMRDNGDGTLAADLVVRTRAS